MLTIVVSGPGAARAQAVAVLRQLGAEVDNDNGDAHGHQPAHAGDAFVTFHLDDVDRAVIALEQIGWSLRGHWETTGSWQRVGVNGAPIMVEAEKDPMAEVARLRAELRAAGITLSED